MCGIIFAIGNSPVEQFTRLAHFRQNHRGPDGSGLLLEKIGDTFIGMAHERLAVIDLTENGRQPMLSASGRFRIIFNGEIYNYRELKSQYNLRGLRSDSDTEVVLELIERLGIDEACRQLNGMWALILHDYESGRIYISRDRFGKKPLYLYRGINNLYMASEMHSLLAAPGLSLLPDPIVVARFLAQSLQNVDDRSWIKDVVAFPPSSIGEIETANPAAGIVRLRRFWEPSLEANRTTNSDFDEIDDLRALVDDAIRLRLHADVPVGVALSGGIDSSIIALEAIRRSSKNNNTVLFSAVSPGSHDDESKFIDIMARKLGVEVQKFELNPAEGVGLSGLLRRCTSFSDGPISSFSSILFYKLMECASNSGITVVLTGQGADEAFCGYRKYPILELKRRLQHGQISSAISLAAGFLLNGTLLPEFNIREAKRYMGVSNVSLLGPIAESALSIEHLSKVTTLAERQWADISKYSVPYLCHYEDRMSMALSREVRSPFLDYRVVERGLQMPERLKLNRGWTKYALRKAFENDLPSQISWRKDKKGFVNPQDDWLKGTLRNEVIEMMSAPEAQVYRYGLVDRDAYLCRFDNYCAGAGNVWFRDVFAPFALELWLQELDEIVISFKKIETEIFMSSQGS